MVRKAALVLALLLASCGDDPAQAPAAYIDTSAAMTALKAEPKVLDILHQPGEAFEWNLGVLDDGTRRDGFAQYVCGVLKEHNAVGEGVSVRIVDIAKVKQSTSLHNAELGTADCSSLMGYKGVFRDSHILYRA